MGLDQYLYRREYVSAYSFKQTDKAKREANIYNQIIKEFGVERCEDSPHLTVEMCVGYWRKANAIHKWFCDLDGGRDECQEIAVPREKLVELRDLCKQVVREPAMAGDVLPPQEGFFFGSYEIDEWYMNDMKHTVTMLNKILSSTPEEGWPTSFTYRASW
jgi:hypothetical protein